MTFGFGPPKKNTAASPAAKLHTRYNVLTAGRSNLADWKTILSRGVSPKEAECLISYFENQGYFPKTTAIISHLDKHLADAAMDPVAQRYPYTTWATELAEKLDREGNPVPPEYIQAARDNYSAYLDAMLQVCKDIWVKLPTPTDFVQLWFEEQARYGSWRMRCYHTGHPKFRALVLAYCRSSGIFGDKILHDPRLKSCTPRQPVL